MRVVHTSDNHGAFSPIKGRSIDVIIHSGDLLPDPDPSHGHKKDIIEYWQRKWVWDHIEQFKTWIGALPFLFTLGNHDFAGAEWLET